MADTQLEPVEFDLSTVRRPANEGNTKPFTARLTRPAADEGDEDETRTVTFLDPQTLTWQQLLEISHPVTFLRYVLTADDRKFIAEVPMQGWQFNELMKRYMRHFKIDEAALRARQGTPGL